MFNVYSKENQNFYLNNSLISGVQNVGFSYQNDTRLSLSVGSPDFNYFSAKPIVANLELTYLLSSSDDFIKYTGSSSFFGKVEYGNNFFTFSSGYLTNYSLNYKLGEYPSVSIQSLIFGELGSTSGNFSYSPKVLNNFNIGDPCYVQLNLIESNLNRLESFDISMSVPREPVYTIGNYLPEDVIIKYPININLNFSFSMSEYSQEKVTNIFTGITQRDLNLSFKKYQSNEDLLILNLSNLVNADTKISYSLDDAKLNLSFNTYILSGV